MDLVQHACAPLNNLNPMMMPQGVSWRQKPKSAPDVRALSICGQRQHKRQQAKSVMGRKVLGALPSQLCSKSAGV
jgi:hypothetical protein